LQKREKNNHKELLSSGVMTIDSKGIPSNADSSSKLSINIARGIADQLMAEVHEKAVGQTSGAKFEQMNMNFLDEYISLPAEFTSGKMAYLQTG